MRLSSKTKSLLMIVVVAFVFLPVVLYIFPGLMPSDGFQSEYPGSFTTSAIPAVNVGTYSDVASGSKYMTCRSPNPATGAVCPEGTFCEESSRSCIGHVAPISNDPVGYFA
jgi:hypothetical protein